MADWIISTSASRGVLRAGAASVLSLAGALAAGLGELIGSLTPPDIRPVTNGGSSSFGADGR